MFEIFKNPIKVKELRSQIADLQNSVSILIGNATETTSKGNPYRDYKSAISALSSKYEGTAEWGVPQVKNIIDIRSAFIIGQGINIACEEKDARELEFIKDLVKLNNIDEEMPQELAKEAEIEGRSLVKLIPNEEERNIDVRFLSYTSKGYKINTEPDDYQRYTEAVYLNSGSQVIIPANEFVYKKLSGRADKVNDIMPKAAMILKQCEDLDKALYDWRQANYYFGVPTPYFKCVDKNEVDATYQKMQKSNWKVGKAYVGTADFKMVEISGSGLNSIKEEIIMLAKIISGGTGVPVHFLGLPDLMTNRAVSCYDEETETLTENGWKKYYEIEKNEKIACFDSKTEKMVFEKPNMMYVHKYKGKMFHFKNKSNDILVTPDHKMLTYAKEGKYAGKGGGKRMAWQKIKAEDLVKRFRIQFRDNCSWEGFDIKDIKVSKHNSKYEKRDNQPVIFKADDFIEFAGYYISEGGCGLYKTTGKRKNRYHSIIHIAQNKGEKADKIRKCLKRMKLKFNECMSGKCIRWHIHHSGLSEYLNKNFGSSAYLKKIPSDFRNMPTGKLEILFNAMMLGDGHFKNNSRYGKRGYYGSVSKRLIDDVQEILLKLGFSTGNVRFDKKISSINHINTKTWRVNFFNKKNRHIFKTDVKNVDYDGIVYCFNTRTGVYFTRRNGRVAIQGNTDLFEFINASTNKERHVWEGFYEELFDKALLMANDKFKFGFRTGIVKAKVNTITEAQIRQLVEIWLPLYTAGVVDLNYILSKIPDINIEEVKKAQEESSIKMLEALKRQEKEPEPELEEVNL